MSVNNNNKQGTQQGESTDMSDHANTILSVVKISELLLSSNLEGT